MITATTLNKATAQEVFDQVVNHLLTQGTKSINEEMRCMYRGLNGTKCAAGCLISDEEYQKEFETLKWGALPFPSVHDRLIDELQTIHDSYGPGEWHYKLKLVSSRHNLQFNPPN